MTNPPTDERRVTDAMVEAAKSGWMDVIGRYGVDRTSFDQRMRAALKAALSHQGEVLYEVENRGLRKGLKIGYEMGQEGQSELFNTTLASWEREAKEMRQESQAIALISKAEKV